MFLWNFTFSLDEMGTNIETLYSVLPFLPLCFFQGETNLLLAGRSLSNNPHLYFPPTPLNSSITEHLPLDPDYIPRLKKEPSSLSYNPRFWQHPSGVLENKVNAAIEYSTLKCQIRNNCSSQQLLTAGYWFRWDMILIFSIEMLLEVF